MGLTGHKNIGGGMPGSKSKSLGFNMKGSPYSMNQPLHGNAFIGAKVKAEQQGKDSFNVDGKTFPVKKSDSQGPEILGAIGGFLAKKALPFVAKTVLGKGAGTLASKAVAGIGGALKEKMGEGEGGIGFGEKVKNYVGSLDLITNSNPDGSIRKDGPSTSADSDKNIANTEVDLGKRNPGETVGADLKMPSLSLDQTPKKSIPEQAGVKDLSKLPGLNMEGPLNKLKNMCRR